MSRQARLGLVVLLGIAATIGFLFVIASQGNLLARTFALRAPFERVAGLKEGAAVFYNGIAVGRVEEVALPESPGAPIMVRMQIDEEARPLIREDSQALIQTDGLVGNVIVALTGGTDQSPEVAEDGLIEGVEPFEFTAISDRLFESVSRFDSVSVQLSGIMTDIRTGEGTLGRFLYDEQLYDASVATTQELQTTLQNLSVRADGLLAVAENASAGVNSILQKVNTGNGTVARFLNEDEVYATFLATATELQASAAQFQSVAADARGITDRFQNAAGWASLGAFRFSENMEALKHNFLFRSYFEDRGYYEMAPFEIREQAISETVGDLQEWERRLYRQQQELDATRAEMGRIRAELDRRGIVLPEAPAGPPTGTPAGAPGGASGAVRTGASAVPAGRGVGPLLLAPDR